MMKRILAAALALVSIGAVAATKVDVDAYKQGLNDAFETCAAAYRSAQLDQTLARRAGDQQRQNYGTAPSEPSLVEAAKTFAACKADAQAKGQELYRAFAAAQDGAQVKADARATLVAWIAFLGVAGGSTSDYQAIEWGEYRKAGAALDLDAAGL